ncbi:hypothetical protein [Roseisalinus antarcticus]|uniref:hypothetical protein n=1 Tax=Roseisalinus antarcticus TaxID=254357 RepID=UPI00117A86EB|nr:hypothetical protein [Roseisalinus antarcticus]
MDWNDIIKIVGTLGGIATVSAGVAAFVGNFISSRLVETHKANLNLQLETHKGELNNLADRKRLILKRQELMFEREYAAAAEFYRFFSGVIPDPWAPDLDWGDAQAHIAGDFHRHASGLKRFLIEHSASLSQTVRRTLEKAKQVANKGIFEVGYETRGEDYDFDLTPSEGVRKIVDQFYDLLKDADKQIRSNLESGSFSGSDDRKSI